jgi:ATP-dependent Zn protease
MCWTRTATARAEDTRTAVHAHAVDTSGSDVVEMYAGVGASRVRKLFKDARPSSWDR